MENMSDTKNEKVQQGDRNSLTMSDIGDDIIDVSGMDFSDHDTWLQSLTRNVSNESIHDLDAWLRTDVDQDCNNSHDNRRSIDTRTFTRPKKRSGRLSFESIVETTVSCSPNLWNHQLSPSIGEKQEDKDNAEFERLERDCTPPMLRPSMHGASGLNSITSTLTSGQESLEAFLNMSQSKGIDSFINLAEPEFNDDIMDVSQPSVLYSSMMSVPIDDSSQTINQSMASNNSQISRHSGIEDSQILTESMMQSSMFGDVVDVNFNDTFAKSSANITVVENTSFCGSMDTTFLAGPIIAPKGTINSTFNTATFNRSNVKSLDETYTPSKLDATMTNDDPYASYVVHRSPRRTLDVTIPSVDDASFVVRSEIVDDTSFVVRSGVAKNTSFIVKNEVAKDTSFVVNSERAKDTSFIVQNEVAKDASFVVKPEIVNDRSSVEKREIAKDTSFIIKTKTPDIKENTTFKLNALSSEKKNDTFNLGNFDATFEKTPLSSPRKLSLKLPSKLPLTRNEAAINETFEAPNREKVCAKMNSQKSIVEPVSRGGSLDNLDSTFCKPAPKVHSKLNPPRPLSRLPQSFQKSNPNLGSSTLKLGNTRSGIPSFGFNRPARPSTARNLEGTQLTGKLHGLGKMKSGSEQRLDVTRNVSDLQTTGTTGGSTESIDSTQSAHSAPDFDDRLSVRSDGSNASYSMRTLNIDDFTKIVRMREECLKQESTPKPTRRLLENNWVARSNDLPSPILKNDPEAYGSRGSSPRSTDSTVKTSSPLLSPTGSLQNLTIDVVESNKDNKMVNTGVISQNKNAVPQKISQTFLKPPKNIGEQRTGLRPPASWTSTNRPASGIPRPASRIPAPRFARPNTKINQGDTKK